MHLYTHPGKASEKTRKTSVAKQSEAALNYMLESVRKFVDSVIRAPQHIIN